MTRTSRLDKLTFKFLNESGKSPYQYCSWNLPTEDGKPGNWMRKLDLSCSGLRLCRRGYHLTRWQHLASWSSNRLFIAEYRDAMLEPQSADKLAVQSARLVKEIHRVGGYKNTWPWDNWTFRALELNEQKKIIRKFLKAQGVDV